MVNGSNSDRLFSKMQVTLSFYKLLSLIVLIFMTISCQTRNETWQRIEQTGVLKIGLDPTYPPFEAVNDEGCLVWMWIWREPLRPI